MELNQSFIISINYDRKFFNLLVECIYRDNCIEKYKVSTKSHDYIFKCNWPVLRARNLTKRMPNWFLIEGNIKYKSVREKITKAIEEYVIINYKNATDK